MGVTESDVHPIGMLRGRAWKSARGFWLVHPRVQIATVQPVFFINLSILGFKKNQEILLCWLRLARFVFGVAWVNFALLRECLLFLFWTRLSNELIFFFELLSGAVSIFFTCFIAKWALRFFCSFCLCILHHVDISVLCNCLFVWVLVFLVFDIIYIIACLPYFWQSFCVPLVWFLLPKPSLFTFCLLEVFLSVTSWFVGGFP